MTQTLFWAVLAAISLNLATIALSIARPDLRVWPPPRRDSWQFVYNGVVTFTSLLGFLALGILDGNSFGLQGSPRWVAVESWELPSEVEGKRSVVYRVSGQSM